MAKKEALLVARELLNDGKALSADAISRATKIPKWKVSRLLKRFERLGWVSSSDEITFSVGRPRKIYSVTQRGMEFFGEMGIEILGIIKKPSPIDQEQREPQK